VSIRSDIVDDLLAAVQQVTVANGYRTDLGLNVRHWLDGDPGFERTQQGCVVRVLGGAPTEQASGTTQQVLRVSLHAWKLHRVREQGQHDGAFAVLEPLLADLEQAVAADYSRGGRAYDTRFGTYDFVEERGDSEVLLRVDLDLEVVFPHDYGDPESYGGGD